MQNYFLVLSYNGTHFNGWQAQGKASLRTVQEVLENTVNSLNIFCSPVKITASGRTDAGVHALNQVCSFAAQTTVPPEKLADCFNAKLPPDVRVQKSGLAPENFDACRSAKQKTYVYSLYVSERENPLKEEYCVKILAAPDLDAMRSAAEILTGEHDFKAFCASNSSAKTTVRTIYSIKILQEPTFTGEEMRVYVTGNGFLYNMVRTLVGTLLDVGFHKKSLQDVEYALTSGDRSSVGKTMPAKGLCLYSVEYKN
ncbi:MAG: tRNA pseudouridine(38-40) synthase TruA [Clostridia bacterium]|nr:tRNA pseudouridine(38-40) synthase TruA [Clostridia bacterium]